MARYFSILVVWGCVAAFVAGSGVMLYCLVDVQAFARLAQNDLHMAIRWETVTTAQWYSLLLLTAINVAIGLTGLFFLRRAFLNFARGKFFDVSNSKDLRLFSVFLFMQAIAAPVYHSLASVLLSWNHAPGEKMLSIAIGSSELQVVLLAMILWVISDMLVRGVAIQQENQQFI
ncbi:MAG: hypothetical protein AAGA95_14380 [Pseudomonadota bacterium]